jgi:hypothetical protein
MERHISLSILSDKLLMRCLSLYWEHIAEDFLQRHGMAAQAPIGEEMAGAVPLSIFIAGVIIVVLATEFHGKLGESYPVGFLSISIGFFNLPDQAGLHMPSLLNVKKRWPNPAQRFVSILPSLSLLDSY